MAGGSANDFDLIRGGVQSLGADLVAKVLTSGEITLGMVQSEPSCLQLVQHCLQVL